MEPPKWGRAPRSVASSSTSSMGALAALYSNFSSGRQSLSSPSPLDDISRSATSDSLSAHGLGSKSDQTISARSISQKSGANLSEKIADQGDWAQIFFKYSIPQVRNLDVQIQQEIKNKKEQLQSLVGKNYPGILSTTESIAAMGSVVDEHLDNLGRLADQCQSSAWERNWNNLSRFNKESLDEKAGRYTLAAQETFVRQCTMQANRLLHLEKASMSGNTTMLVCELYLLATTLLSSVDLHKWPKAAFSYLQSYLENTKQGITRYIGDFIKNAPETAGIAIQANIAAFVILENVTIRESLIYFLNTRAEGINSLFQRASMSSEDNDQSCIKAYIGCLDMIESTYRQAKQLFPRLVENEIEKVGGTPSLGKEAILKVFAMGIRSFEPWLPQPVKDFTPCARSDNGETLSGEKVESIIYDWASDLDKNALACFNSLLACLDSPSAIVDIRREVLEPTGEGELLRRLCIGDNKWNAATGVTTCKDRLLELVSAHVEDLPKIIQGIDFNAERGQIDSLGLWDDTLINMDISHGAAQFIDSVKMRSQGLNGAFASFSQSYSEWLETEAELSASVASYAKLEGQLSRFGDGSSAFNEWESLEMLALDVETKELTEALDGLSIRAHDEFLVAFENQLSSLNDNISIQPLVGYLRISRLTGETIDKLKGQSTQTLKEKHTNISKRINRRVANYIVDGLDNEMGSTFDIEAYSRITDVQEPLWIKTTLLNPQASYLLPNQCTVTVFRMWDNISRSAAEYGLDILSKELTFMIRESLETKLMEKVMKLANALYEGDLATREREEKSNGNHDERQEDSQDDNHDVDDYVGESEDQKSESIPSIGKISLQLMFDVEYSLTILRPKQTSDNLSSSDPSPLWDTPDKIIENVLEVVGEKSMIDKVRRHIASSALDYLKSTRIFFDTIVN